MKLYELESGIHYVKNQNYEWLAKIDYDNKIITTIVMSRIKTSKFYVIRYENDYTLISKLDFEKELIGLL
jgi:hypothetical protein